MIGRAGGLALRYCQRKLFVGGRAGLISALRNHGHALVVGVIAGDGLIESVNLGQHVWYFIFLLRTTTTLLTLHEEALAAAPLRSNREILLFLVDMV